MQLKKYLIRLPKYAKRCYSPVNLVTSFCQVLCVVALERAFHAPLAGLLLGVAVGAAVAVRFFPQSLDGTVIRDSKVLDAVPPESKPSRYAHTYYPLVGLLDPMPVESAPIPAPASEVSRKQPEAK